MAEFSLSDRQHQGSMRGEFKALQSCEQASLGAKGPKHNHLSARTDSAGGPNRLEQTSGTCLCPHAAQLKRSNPGEVMLHFCVVVV